MKARNDLELYEDHSARWWDLDDRFFRSLRSVGTFHLGLIRREWGSDLEGLRLVDLGCGGGFLSLALAGCGARVTGIDASAGSVEAARAEAGRRGLAAEFVHGDLYDTALPSGSCDLVVLADVLEHLEQPGRALVEAARLLRAGGRVFLSTFDRTWLSRLAVVDLAEGLGLVPRGTHDPRLFIRPDELRGYASAAGLVVDRLVCERPALLRTLLTWTIHVKESRRGHGFSAFLRKAAG